MPFLISGPRGNLEGSPNPHYTLFYSKEKAIDYMVAQAIERGLMHADPKRCTSESCICCNHCDNPDCLYKKTIKEQKRHLLSTETKLHPETKSWCEQIGVHTDVVIRYPDHVDYCGYEEWFDYLEIDFDDLDPQDKAGKNERRNKKRRVR